MLFSDDGLTQKLIKSIPKGHDLSEWVRFSEIVEPQGDFSFLIEHQTTKDSLYLADLSVDDLALVISGEISAKFLLEFRLYRDIYQKGNLVEPERYPKPVENLGLKWSKFQFVPNLGPIRPSRPSKSYIEVGHDWAFAQIPKSVLIPPPLPKSALLRE